MAGKMIPVVERLAAAYASLNRGIAADRARSRIARASAPHRAPDAGFPVVVSRQVQPAVDQVERDLP
jgi:hypothetical protein